MHAFGMDRLLDAITGAEMVIAALWLGLAAISISLLVLIRTRWGQSQPLRKCIVLSLLAHLLLVGYATTVQIVASNPRWSQEPIVKIAIAEEDYELQASSETKAAVEKPWEAFADPSAPPPSPLELARAETADLPEGERRMAAEPEKLTPDPVPRELDLDDAAPPEPQDLPLPSAAGAVGPAKAAEPIRTPAAQRNERPALTSPAGPAVERHGPPDPPPLETKRQTPEGIEASLVDQPRSVPKMQDVPVSEDPRDSLAALDDTLPSPPRGKPAEHHPPQEPAGASARPDAALAAENGQTDGSINQLRPPAAATQEDNLGDNHQLVSVPPDARDRGLLLPASPAKSGGSQMPDVYQLRVAPDRSQIARRLGATPETEEAVRAALRWLAANQEPDGRWNAAAHGAGRELLVAGRDRLGAGSKADTGMTGLALLAFLAAGYTHKGGDYEATVDKGLKFLLVQQDDEGGLVARPRSTRTCIATRWPPLLSAKPTE